MRTRLTIAIIPIVLAVLLGGCTSVPTAPTATTADPAAGPSGDPAPDATQLTSAAPVVASDDAPSAYESAKDELLALQKADGTPAALAVLEARIRNEPAVSFVCHAIAHELGHAAVEQAGGRARAALKIGSEVCGGGYTHGVIETALGTSTHPTRDLLRICAPRNDGSCFHGVGHGVMFATDMNVARSLRLCDRAPTFDLSSRCGEGVFMQLFSSDLSAQHVSGTASLDVASDPDAAQARCRGTRVRYAANCWFYAPTVYLTVHPDDFAGAMGWCRDAGSDLGRQLCARGVGSRSVKYHADDLSIGSAVCATAGAMTDSCLQGMGSYWSVHHEGRVEPSEVCAGVTPKSLRARCRQVV